MVYKPGRCLLKQLLHKISKDQQWLSDVTGISKTQISEYANDKRTMMLATAKTISKALGCSIDDLYEWIVISR